MFTNVAVRVALGGGGVPTASGVGNVTVLGVIEKPAVDTGTTVVPPPPPQDVDHNASATQAIAMKTALPPLRLSVLVSYRATPSL